jgi:hypothetical protein
MAIAGTLNKRVPKDISCRTIESSPSANCRQLPETKKRSVIQKNTWAQLSRTEANRYDFSAIPDMESTFDVGLSSWATVRSALAWTAGCACAQAGELRIDWILREKSPRRRRLTTVCWAFDWQAYKDGNPILDVASRQHERRLLLNVRSLNCRWVLDPPMGAFRLTHPDRARFTSGVVTKGKNEIHRVCRLGRRIPPSFERKRSVEQPRLFKLFECERIGDAHRVSARR